MDGTTMSCPCSSVYWARYRAGNVRMIMLHTRHICRECSSSGLDAVYIEHGRRCTTLRRAMGQRSEISRAKVLYIRFLYSTTLGIHYSFNGVHQPLIAFDTFCCIIKATTQRPLLALAASPSSLSQSFFRHRSPAQR